MPVCDAEDPNRPGVKCTFREDLHKHRHSWEAARKANRCNVSNFRDPPERCVQEAGHNGVHKYNMVVQEEVSDDEPQCLWSEDGLEGGAACTFPKGHEGDHSYDCEPAEEDDDPDALCCAMIDNGDDDIRCHYRSGHKGKCSWGEKSPEVTKSRATIAAFAKVFEALEGLEPEQRWRVLKAACVILDINLPSPAKVFR